MEEELDQSFEFLLQKIYVVAACFNVTCCAYPFIGIYRLKGKNKNVYPYYDVLKFSYFCMCFWLAYGLGSGEIIPLVANISGVTTSGFCLLTYAWIFKEYKKVLRHLFLGLTIFLTFQYLDLYYLIPLASIVTGRLYMYCWIDISYLRLSKNPEKIDLLDCTLNSINTIGWFVYGLLEKDLFIFTAFFFGFSMYVQIFSYYFYYKFFLKTVIECKGDQINPHKDLQA